jgi:hypothetical protein
VIVEAEGVPMRPLSDQWVNEVTATIARDSDLPEPITDHDTMVRLRIFETGGPDALMHLQITPNAVLLRSGVPEGCAVELRCSFATLARLCRREITAGDAFRGGDVALIGDIEALIGLDEVFDELVWAMGEVSPTAWQQDQHDGVA